MYNNDTFIDVLELNLYCFNEKMRKLYGQYGMMAFKHLK